MPGVWLFHIGNAHSFVNVIPATFSGRLLTTVPQKQMLRTTPEYPPGEYDTEDDSFDDEQEYNIDQDFVNTDTTEFPQPDHSAPRTSGQSQEGDSNLSLLNHYEVKVTLSPDPQTEHTAPTNVPAEEVVDSVHPVPKHPLLEAYPVHPEGEVVNVEDDVHFDTGGEAETVGKKTSMPFLHFFVVFFIPVLKFQALLKSNSCSSSPSVTPSFLQFF